MMIDCDACAVRGPACGDCVVTVLLGAPPVRDGGRPPEAAPDPWADPEVDQAIDLDGREQAAIAVLAGSGLVPPLRLVPVDRSSDVVRPAEPDGDRRGDGRPGDQGRAAV
jgi:hypothetical protein